MSSFIELPEVYPCDEKLMKYKNTTYESWSGGNYYLCVQVA